jgi:manganese/iron transport system permease protein
MLHYLTDPLQFTFMQRALVAVVFTGLACGVLGSYVVLRGLAFIGDALTHAVFPGVVIAFAAGQSVLLGALAVGLVTAAGIAVLSRGRRVSEDTAIGILFAAMFALVAVGAVALLNKELALLAFDREMAEAMRYPVFVLDLVLLGLIAVAIVVSLRAIGNILVLAMLVTPAATARLLTDRLVTMQAAAAAIGAASGVVGLYISFWWNVASGGAVVLTATAVFFAVFLAQAASGALRPGPG